jgi:hypothetical protein
MIASKPLTNVKFSAPNSYRISAKGYLDESWAMRFSGLQISNQVLDDSSHMVTFVGSVNDQTELIGVLNSIYEMHLPLVSVELLGSDDEQASLK